MPAETRVQLRLGERVVAEVAFDGAELRIGRMKENDLVINNLAVSRFHAVLRRVGEGFEIEDLGSENGTFVEGIAVRGTAPVPVGGAITIGKHTLSLRPRGAAAGVREPSGAREGRAPSAQATGTPRPAAPRSDVWDAAQTYLVAAPVRGEEVAVAREAQRGEGSVREAVAAPEALLPAELVSEAVELSDPEDSGFGEEDLIGAAVSEPVPAVAEAASVEPDELEPLVELTAQEQLPAAARPELGSQTALFDFGLTDDLGISDRALARAADERSGARPAPAAPARSAAPASPAPPVRPAPAEPLHAGLIVERLGRVERVVPWQAGELVAGRAPDCALVLAASGVSRRHARFVREGAAFRVVDLGSANGIRVNGQKVESGVLAVGDVVAIDDYAITFVLDREPVDGMVRAAAPALAEPRASAPVLGMPERDLVTEAEEEGGPADLEKPLELAAIPAAALHVLPGDETAWHFEITLASERLPAALRRALRELGEDELRLPAELRLVRRG